MHVFIQQMDANYLLCARLQAVPLQGSLED